MKLCLELHTTRFGTERTKHNRTYERRKKCTLRSLCGVVGLLDFPIVIGKVTGPRKVTSPLEKPIPRVHERGKKFAQYFRLLQWLDPRISATSA
jgi:hypothetical protein